MLKGPAHFQVPDHIYKYRFPVTDAKKHAGKQWKSKSLFFVGT